MKYCVHCGSELFDEAIVCPKCGCPATPLDTKAKTIRPLSALALLGFVLSLVAISLFSLLALGSTELSYVTIPFAIAGMVCSIVGSVNAKRKNMRGRGFAVAGIVVSAVVCAIWVIIVMLAFYAILSIYVLILILMLAMV